MPLQAAAAVATLLSFTAAGNRVAFQLNGGAAELSWKSSSTFRFRRVLEGPLPPLAPETSERIPCQIDDLPDAVRLRTGPLVILVRKHGVLVEVRRSNGTLLMADLTAPEVSGAGVIWERQAPPGVRYYGLGPRTDPAFDLRGKSWQAQVPFLLTTAGYGEYHPGGGIHRFDFTAPDRYAIRAPSVDYYFYFGPSPKQIFEEHKDAPEVMERWPAASERFGSWDSLGATLLRVVHAALSGMAAPALSLSPYDGMPEELVQRARQLGSLVDSVSPGRAGLSDLRSQLETFFGTYTAEARERGFPIWHPLPFQYPDDPESSLHPDEFMLGDELLIAPIVQPGGKRSLYLPPGVWTNLETNQVFPGRQKIEVETPALPVFARNGTIVPLDSPGGGIALHYFPSLGAEFFLLETNPDGWTQVHAAPAADIMRLEIEAQKARDYQWVVHHVERPAGVGFQNSKYREAASAASLADRTWFYEAARKDLQIRVRVAAGEDCIINLAF